nr:hypothetical protein BACY1_31130 [Tenacibaculum mesophilum]
MMAKTTEEKDFFNCIQGYSAFTNKLYTKALFNLTEISDDEDYSQIKLYLLGNAYLKSEKYDESVRSFEKWIENDSTSKKYKKSCLS